MAEVIPGTTENTIPAVDTDGPARAARVSGVISTILASPNIAAIKAALGDPEVNAAASSDMGVATLVGVLTSAGSAEEAKVIRELQPTVAEKKQIIDAIAAPAQAAVVTAADANVVAAGGALKQGDTVIASGTAVTPNGDVGGASMVLLGLLFLLPKVRLFLLPHLLLVPKL